jgi:hypothetical protein
MHNHLTLFRVIHNQHLTQLDIPHIPLRARVPISVFAELRSSPTSARPPRPEGTGNKANLQVLEQLLTGYTAAAAAAAAAAALTDGGAFLPFSLSKSK